MQIQEQVIAEIAKEVALYEQYEQWGAMARNVAGSRSQP